MTEKTVTLHWHKYPEEKPESSGYYLTKSWERNPLTGKYRSLFRVCLYIDGKEYPDIKGFFYNGNEFFLTDFYYINVSELE